MAAAAPVSWVLIAGPVLSWVARSLRVRRMCSPAWQVMAAARAFLRHDAEVAAGAQPAGRAKRWVA
jgi:hypothetical protein